MATHGLGFVFSPGARFWPGTANTTLSTLHILLGLTHYVPVDYAGVAIKFAWTVALNVF